MKLSQQKASNKNRIIRILEDCNIKLSSVLSDVNGVIGTKLIDNICTGKGITMDYINSIYHRRLQASKEDIYEACQGFVTEDHIYLLQMIKGEILHTEEVISELDIKIKTALSEYDNVLEALRGIPSLGTTIIKSLIAEIGLDMSVFPSEKHLSSWAGISPGNNESAGKKSGRTTHGNKQLKAVLTEATWVATRTKGTFFAARYHRIAAGHGEKRALVAVAHSILIAVYHVIKDDCDYKELGVDYWDAKLEKKRRSYLTKELEKMGYDVMVTRNMPKQIC